MENHDDNERAIRRYTKISTGATVIIAVAAVLTLGAAVLQWLVFKDQLREMRATGDQTDLLIRAARDSAAAADKQAIISEKSQRAWIAPLRFEMVKINEEVEPLKVRMAYSNVGREPATNVRVVAAILFFGPLGFDFAASPEKAPWDKFEGLKAAELCGHDFSITAPSVLYPIANAASVTQIGQRTKDASRLDLQSRLIKKTRGHDDILVVAGCFQYESAGRLHHTSFCTHIFPDTPGDDLTQWPFLNCPIGNDEVD